MLESIDEGIGSITRKLDQLGLADNTILIFTSDNGGETTVTSNAPLRGGKSQLYEGGIRVPLIVRWPADVPAGTVCEWPTVNVDFYPTLLEAARIDRDSRQILDGVSMLATWRNPMAKTNRQTIYWHYPLDSPHFLGGLSSGAIRDGDWKLIEYFQTGQTELYSLADDVSEKHNLASQPSERVRELKAQLTAWRNDIQARVPSPPLLTTSRGLVFADHFSPRQVSRRWFFTKDWSVENGVLQRSDVGTGTTRIFLRDARFRDVMIRFDFQFQEAQDIRLVTGASGHYNAVIHIRPDHFHIQTAKDSSGPYFSYRHGECAYEFDSNRWYTMTVEFLGDQLVAHVDRDHLAYARHPILDRERDYFALQVDDQPAALDNVQILAARPHPRQAENLEHILAVSGQYPVEKPLTEAFRIQKTNAHEWLYQRDVQYRALDARVAELDARKKALFPAAFGSSKEFQKRILALRKKLNQEDPRYQEMLHATHRAKRAIDAWLFAQKPGSADLPDSRRERELERLRDLHRNRPEYLRLVAAGDEAQQRLEQAYPQLFVSDEHFKQTRIKQRGAVKDNPDYKKLTAERAASFRAQQEYLLAHDPKLARLQKALEREP